MADDGRRRMFHAETSETRSTTTSTASEAYDALTSYTFFLQRQNEALARALQMSLSSSSSSFPSSSSDLGLPQLSPGPSLTSKPPAARRARSAEGRNTRRRPRAAARTAETRTYVAADPADFRLIVQQATGARRVPDDAVTETETNWSSDMEVAPPSTSTSTSTLDASGLVMHREGTSGVGDVASGNAGSDSSQLWLEFDPFLDFPNDGFM